MLVLAWLGTRCAGCGDPAQEKPPATAQGQPTPAVATIDAGTSTAAPEPAAPPSVEHAMLPGETLWDIARAYDLRVDDILRANNLSDRDARKLRDGSKLTIPGRTHLVDVETAADRASARAALPPLKDGVYHHLKRGETLWTLSQQYDVAMEVILERNQLDDESAARLREGQTIAIPGVDATRQKAAAKRSPKGIRHTMAAGETIWDLARVFSVGAGQIMAANGLSESTVRRLREGEVLLIPGVKADKRGRVRRTPSARKKRAASVARKLGLGTRAVARSLLAGKVKPAWIRAAGAQRLPGTLRWPVTKGWYVRGFGSGEGGYHQAVDIMGKIGWNVRAAAPGIVAYSGNEVRGYGNIVMLVHPGGWVTMYAHNSANFVVAGDRVTRGAILAEVGSTGISRGPHVHFELIFDRRNCDPGPLFRPAIRHRRKAARTKQVVWHNAKKRPREIRCDRRRRHPRSRWVSNESVAVDREARKLESNP